MNRNQTAKEFSESHRPNWVSHDTFHLYRTPSQRFVCTWETVDINDYGFDLNRANELAESGISESDFDAEEFSKDFVEKFCNYLSIFEINVLLNYLSEYKEMQSNRQR